MLKAVVVYGTTYVTLTLALATWNCRVEKSGTRVCDYDVMTLDVIICAPEPFTLWHWTVPVCGVFVKAVHWKPFVDDPFTVTVYTCCVMTLGRVAM